MSTQSATIQPNPIASPAGQPKVGIIMGSQSDWVLMMRYPQKDHHTKVLPHS